MRHHNKNRKFGRVTKTRKALMNSLARSLILHSKIKTTLPKAKELRPFVEKIITKGKNYNLSIQRDLIAIIGREAAKIVTGPMTKKYEGRKGGYTRIIKLPKRLSDGSEQALIEFV